MAPIAGHGDSGMGKAIIMQRFRDQHPPHLDRRSGVLEASVLATEMVSRPGERRFYGELFCLFGTSRASRSKAGPNRSPTAWLRSGCLYLAPTLVCCQSRGVNCKDGGSLARTVRNPARACCTVFRLGIQRGAATTGRRRGPVPTTKERPVAPAGKARRHR
ncbi:TniB family NTP-binding protein [Roseobacter denitrificans]|uniref:TniB family NTP-binding protein n=2 Tax=Roseobacter denitrificans TaxID=2434 RepID=UPI00094582C6